MAKGKGVIKMGDLKVKLPKLGQARSYTLEFVLMLGGVFALLSAISYMFNSVLSYVADVNVPGILSSWEYQMSVSVIAGVLVLLPVSVVLFLRAKARAKKDKSAQDSNVRRNFLSIFLAALFAIVVVNFVRLSADLINSILNIGLNQDTAESVWLSALRRFFDIGIYAWVFLFFYKERGNKAKDEKSSKRFLLGFSGLAILLAVLLAVMPLKSQRNSYIDNQIEQDLYAIQTAASDFFSDEQKLPLELSELDLKEDLIKRAEKYDYSYSRLGSYSYAGQYELCAVFKTDTTNDYATGPANLLMNSSIFPDAELESHTAGRDCFELDTSTAGIYDYGVEATNPTDLFDLKEFDFSEFLPSVDI